VLIGISPLISPDMLAVLSKMGHGDEIVLADAHFPGESNNSRILRADGIRIPPLLEGILKIFPLDDFVESPLIMMEPVPGSPYDPNTEETYRASIQTVLCPVPRISRIDRFDFYERTRKAFAVVMTGETARYGNIILKKGVVMK